VAANPETRTESRAVLAGALLSCVGLASFLLLPTLVEAAVSDLHYSERQVGILAAALSAGQTLTGLLSALWIRRSPWPRAAAITLLGLVAANGAATVLHGFAAFVVLQAIVGLFGGSLYSLSLTILSDGGRPERHFAYAIGAQTVYQIAALVAGPALIRAGGVNAVLGLFIAMSAAGLLLVRWIPVYGHRAAGVGPAYGALLRLPVLLALVGCFLFYVNIGAFWTYVVRIGSAAGLGLDAISNGVAFATLTSIAGVVFASWFGVRRGYVSPIAASAVVIALAAAMLSGRPSLTAFVVANVVYSIAWNVSMTYQYSVVNAVDDSRRGIALAPSFHSAGGAAGPAVAALFVTATDHDGALWLVAGSVLASVACFVLSLRLHGPGARPSS
jgi:predicted MFS family arabinose efflux permease